MPYCCIAVVLFFTEHSFAPGCKRRTCKSGKVTSWLWCKNSVEQSSSFVFPWSNTQQEEGCSVNCHSAQKVGYTENAFWIYFSFFYCFWFCFKWDLALKSCFQWVLILKFQILFYTPMRVNKSCYVKLVGVFFFILDWVFRFWGR